MDRRKQKFSKESTEKIRNNFLLDVSLLSRQQNAKDFTKLLNLQSERDKLLFQIQDCSNDELIEHGLRKLREVVVAIWDSNKDDPIFIHFVQNVYVESYNFFLRVNKINMIGNIVLEFLVKNLPQFAKERGFLTIYILYVSHVEMDINKSILVMLNFDFWEENLINLATFYCIRKTKPDKWFQILTENYINDQLVIEFLEVTGKITELQERCLTVCSKSYNQLSLNAFNQIWLHNYPLNSIIETKIIKSFSLQTTTDDVKVIHFKQR